MDRRNDRYLLVRCNQQATIRNRSSIHNLLLAYANLFFGIICTWGRGAKGMVHRVVELLPNPAHPLRAIQVGCF